VAPGRSDFPTKRHFIPTILSGSGKLQHFCMRRWSKDCLALGRTRIEIEGLEYIDPSCPQMIMANHSGAHDILSLAAYLPVQFRWIAKKSLFNIPFLGWHMRRSGYIAVDRENPRETAKSISLAAEVIRNGVSAIAFPEGTRSKDGVLGKFYTGVFSLALRAGVPVVPIVLDGSYRVVIPGEYHVNSGIVIRIKVGRPIDLSAYARNEKQRLMEDVFQVMNRNLDQLRGIKQAEPERIASMLN
jgi:1-acyl-sn-glycerol-3-phosphate acyltransferase